MQEQMALLMAGGVKGSGASSSAFKTPPPTVKAPTPYATTTNANEEGSRGKSVGESVKTDLKKN